MVRWAARCNSNHLWKPRGNRYKNYLGTVMVGREFKAFSQFLHPDCWNKRNWRLKSILFQYWQIHWRRQLKWPRWNHLQAFCFERTTLMKKGILVWCVLAPSRVVLICLSGSLTSQFFSQMVIVASLRCICVHAHSGCPVPTYRAHFGVPAIKETPLHKTNICSFL